MGSSSHSVLSWTNRSMGSYALPVVVASVGLLLAGVTACGSSSTGTSSSSTASAGTQAASAGKAATGTPIKVGFIYSETGSVAYPQNGPASKGAVYYINKVAGGIHGHPILLETCNSDGTAATNINCANKFVTENVVAVVDDTDPSAGSEIPILNKAGIPMVGMVAGEPPANSNPDGYYFGPASQAFALGPLQVVKEKGAKSVALVDADAPGARAYVDGIVLPAAKALGLKATATFYEEGSANWPVIAESLAAKKADLTGFTGGTESDCTSLLQALKQIGFSKQIFLGGCSDFIQQAGDSDSAGVLSYSAVWLPAMAESAPARIKQELAIYASAMKATGNAAIKDQRAVVAFSAIVNLAQVMSTYGKAPYTAASATAALKSVKNYNAFLGPNGDNCGTPRPWANTSSCTNSMLVTVVKPDGSIAPALGSGYAPLNTSILPAG
jgi:branched-chain amino acid transport system substrate-binding protein